LTTTFLGVDLGWFGKPTGVCAASIEEDKLLLHEVGRVTGFGQTLDWISAHAGPNCVCAVDAPLVIPNQRGIRRCEEEHNREFQRYHAGCHPANLSRPFAPYVTSFSRELEGAGFRHGPDAPGPEPNGRWQIEVHPHAAAVNLFGLDRIIKYKRGVRADRSRELQRLRTLVTTALPLARTELIPDIPATGLLKPAEDQIDGVLCAFVAAHWWAWGRKRNYVFGSTEAGYIVVPARCDRNVRPATISTTRSMETSRNT
jgi:predicted RNase H-like nuclease